MNLLKVLLNNLKFNNLGVTMIELMMVITVLCILSVASIGSYHTWQKHVMLVNATDELKSAFSLAQGQAIAAAQGNNWGVHLESNYYVIFPGSFYDEANINNQRRNFSGISLINLDSAISDGVGAYTKDVVFAKYTGNTVNVGTLFLAATSNYEHTKSITIDLNGQIQ